MATKIPLLRCPVDHLKADIRPTAYPSRSTRKFTLQADARSPTARFTSIAGCDRRKETQMINRTTLAVLAAVTFLLFIASAAMGEDFGEGDAFLYTLADVVWIGFMICALVLVVLTVSVLVRSLTNRGGRADAHG
jgi:hypothetical protein